MKIIYFTDIHLLENEDSIPGFEMCMEAMLSYEPELMINGGDLGVTPEAVGTYYSMIEGLPVDVHLVNGNHEMCNGSLPREDAGKFSRSFNHGGAHLIIFDVVRYFEPTENHGLNWHVVADEPNIEWLADDLSQVSHDTPLILACHVSLSTSFPFRFGSNMGAEFPTNEVANGERVMKLLEPFGHVATLHGHDHENCRHRVGNIQILTTGAVAGNWWHNGLNSPNTDAAPQGFRVINVDDESGAITNRYVAFQAEQDFPGALFVQEETGRGFVNVYDGSPETKVSVDGVGELQLIDPFDETSKRLPAHLYELPSGLGPGKLEVEICFEDGRTGGIEIES